MAITPGPGYQIDPNNPNAVIPIGSAAQAQGLGSYSTQSQPVQTPPPTTPQQQQVQPPVQQQQPQQQQTQPQQVTPDAPPQTNLQPGASGQDVAALQNYLIQQGYLSASQVGGGLGTYGPQTTAAVAKLQKDLGVQAGSAAGNYGPQTQAALAAKYQGIFQQNQGSQAPASGGNLAVAQQATAAATQSTDPIFSAMAAQMEPIMASLGQVLNNINNPTLTAVSLQQEYNDLQNQYGLPAMNAQLMNMQNIMNGTEQDVRDEVTKAGGFATDSQVMGITAARNKVILKQYNALATQYSAAQTNVQNMMQYASTDQQTQLQKQNMTANIVESMASMQQQMMTMGITMQNHAADNLNKIVTNIGYTGLAAQAQGNPQMLNYYENLLNLAPGTLSNPTDLSQMETYRQQQLALGQQKVQISLQNSGSLTDYRQVMEMSRYSTIATNTIRQMYQSNKNPLQIYNSSAPILSRIDAALPMALDPKNKDKTAPDLDLVDAYVQIARGGQNITEAQVDTLLSGLGIKAKFDVASQKITGTGILDDGTRNSLASLSKGIVSNQQKQANLAVTQINQRLSSISGFPSDMLLNSPADIQLYDTGAASTGGSSFTSDNGTSYVLPY